MTGGAVMIRTLIVGFLAMLAIIVVSNDREGDRRVEETRIICGAADVATDPTRSALCAIRAARR